MTSAIDAEIIAARTAQAQANAPPFDITQLPIAEGRARADVAALFFNDGAPGVAEVRTFAIETRAGPMRARLYRPEASAAAALLYLHGGGWATCNVDTHDSLMRRLALASGAAVVGVDFRLAPEHPFPAPLEDAIDAWRWLTTNAPTLGLDATRLGIAGDSAGALLALALAAEEAPPKALALFYGAYAPRFDLPSHAAYGDGRFGLTTERMRWYWRHFLGAADSDPPIRATPLYADLRGLGPTFLGVAELDPIADDSRLLADKLAAAHVEHELRVWPGAVHGFLQMGRDVALARDAIAEAGAFLSRRL